MRKVCPGCGIEKDYTEYHVRKDAKDGRQSRCKECLLQYHREHREEARKRATEWRRKNGVPEKRRRVRRTGGPGTLFPEET